MAQQPLLAPDAAAETDHLTVAADHPVAGNDQRYPVFVVGVAHGAKGLRTADRPGNIAVGGGPTEGYFLQLSPDGFLKIGPFQN